MSREARIWTLLVIDSVFLVLELVVGYAVGSLALVADSFHMLNDVMSLVVALYAIKLSANSPTSKYSYGWHRAEILAALINGVFLLALCLSIFLEAIVRFFSTPEISNPKLVVIVGSLGLASNIVGLFLFHDIGHSHSHGESPPSKPPSIKAQHKHVVSESIATGRETETSPLLRSTSPRRPDSPESPSSMFGHPAQTRAHVFQAAEQAGYYARSESPLRGLTQSPGSNRLRAQSTTHDHRLSSDLIAHVTEESAPALYSDVLKGPAPGHAHDHHEGHEHAVAIDMNDAEVGGEHDHGEHSHSHSHGSSDEHGHSHGSMNMRGLLLHVAGDALGNVGVITSGLVIWLTDWPGKYYSDPIISIIITCIIFASAMPLVKSASFILLQGVPTHISLDSVRRDIQDVPGVYSLHELHVWQLSETKVVASLHIWVSKDVEYMKVAAAIRAVLHSVGVHSCTIQPEFRPDAFLSSPFDEECLIPCAPGQDCPPDAACCPPALTRTATQTSH